MRSPAAISMSCGRPRPTHKPTMLRRGQRCAPPPSGWPGAGLDSVDLELQIPDDLAPLLDIVPHDGVEVLRSHSQDGSSTFRGKTRFHLLDGEDALHLAVELADDGGRRPARSQKTPP